MSELKIEQVEDDLYVSVNLKNTGNINAKETVQFYVEDLCSKIDRPVRELRAYKKVFVVSGEIRKITVTIPKNSLAFYCEESKAWVTSQGQYILHAGFSSRDLRLVESFEIDDTICS